MRSVLVKLAAGTALALLASASLAQQAPPGDAGPGAQPPATRGDFGAQPRGRVEDVPPPQTQQQRQPMGHPGMHDDYGFRGQQQFGGMAYRQPMQRGPVVDYHGNPIPENLRWRYRWENGRWLYWLPSNRWVVWIGDRWVDYDPRLMDTQFAQQGWCPPGYVYTGGYGQPTYGWDQYGYGTGYGFDPYGTGYRGGFQPGYFDDQGFQHGGYYDDRGWGMPQQRRFGAGYRGEYDDDWQYRQGFRGQDLDRDADIGRGRGFDTGAQFDRGIDTGVSPRRQNGRTLNGRREIDRDIDSSRDLPGDRDRGLLDRRPGGARPGATGPDTGIGTDTDFDADTGIEPGPTGGAGAGTGTGAGGTGGAGAGG